MKRRRTPQEALAIAIARWFRKCPGGTVTQSKPNGVALHLPCEHRLYGAHDITAEDEAEVRRHHLSRSQEQALRDFFHRHNPDCEHCHGVGSYFVDGQKIICMVME